MTMDLDLAVNGADIAPLLMVLVHLTGEEHWLDEVAPHINGPGIFWKPCRRR